MIDWTASMQQTFDFYIVDPNTWENKSLLSDVKACTINRDLDDETLGNATIECTSMLDECYIRVYLVCVQNGIKECFPLGTFLVQTPSDNYDGKIHDNTLEAYTPLLELKDVLPPYGYTAMKGINVMNAVSELTRENARAPVVNAIDGTKLSSNFVADFETDTWLSFLSALSANAKFHFSLDELGRILFNREQKMSSLQPVYTYDDGNSSILYPEISLNSDLYDVPNVVEVLYSTDTGYRFSRIENNDENSPVSIANRGREVVHRVSNPSDLLNPTQQQIDEYARKLLENLSVMEHTLTYKHGYCPVRIGDCVHLNYVRAGLTNIKAKVIRQSISCIPGCPVTETAVFTKQLWG